MLAVSVAWVIPQASLAEEVSVDERLQRLEQRIEELGNENRKFSISQKEAVEERLKQFEQRTVSPGSPGIGEIGNMVFFRGGGAWATSDRSNEVFTDVLGFSNENEGDSGYYVGAGLELVLTKDMWGMLSSTWALGEIGVEFKHFDSKRVTQAVSTTCAVAGVPTCSVQTTKKVQITMLTVNVASKIMFMEGSRFRPLIIPAGLDFHVISPPSNDTTVLDTGVQFAVGVQYRIWKAIHLGVDGRFHLATGQTDTTNNFGTAGAYLGIAF